MPVCSCTIRQEFQTNTLSSVGERLTRKTLTATDNTMTYTGIKAIAVTTAVCIFWSFG
jgi:hypothetical protein